MLDVGEWVLEVVRVADQIDMGEDVGNPRWAD